VTGLVDRFAYADPDPEAVLRIMEGYGVEAARERWHWILPGSLGKIAQAGRELRRAKGGTPSLGAGRRPTTPELEERAIALAREAGSLTHAARETGLSYTLVKTLHRERGLPLPRMSAVERGVKGSRIREARRALAATSL
jgi:hypothetical protein